MATTTTPSEPSDATLPPTYTGRTRRRRTRWTVRAVDRLTGILIRVGGIGTITAVLTVCVFLVWVVLPLFLPASTGPAQRAEMSWPEVPRCWALDETGTWAWSLRNDQTEIDWFRLADGQLAPSRPLPVASTPTAVSLDQNGRDIALGFADGSFCVGTIAFQETTLDREALPAELSALPVGGVRRTDEGWQERLSETAGRNFAPQLTFSELLPLGEFAAEAVTDAERAVRQLDYVAQDNGYVVAGLCADGSLWMSSVVTSKNLVTRKVASRRSTSRIEFAPPVGQAAPAHLLLSDRGAALFLAWPDGRLLRFSVGSSPGVTLVEDIDLLPEDGAQLTAMTWLAGRTTFLAGDSLGRVRAWFLARTANSETGDGSQLVAGHELTVGTAAVTCLGSSFGRRAFVAGLADGGAAMFYVTSEKLLARLAGAQLWAAPDGTGQHAAVVRAALSPKDDRVALWNDGRQVSSLAINLRHPEASFRSLFRSIWYEGYDAPAHTWQSSGGNDLSEVKLGFWPLIFGTIKATVYALLFAVPMALAAAVYTSEFLSPRARTRIKPIVELMASLPSVVLGFLGALVLAPRVEQFVPELLALIVLAPLSVIVGACCWQLLPRPLTLRFARARPVGVAVALLAGGYAAISVGPWGERLLFGEKLVTWLAAPPDPQTATPGWLLLLLAPVGVGVAVLFALRVSPLLRCWGTTQSHTLNAAVELLKLVAGVALTVAIAAILARGLAWWGFDPRGNVLGPYDQRNALVVGFVMGFAIIPLMYTLAEDALNSVPQHLRSASLGAGATPWQTAVRIVVPTAMSGLFSAVMVGLGRAVGETMIVLMAAGNTPIMEWNLFNGFRTLSATIATEIAEAPQHSTHYRVLFLAALTLFVLTFVINTAAEMVRQRFRRRAYQL